MTLNREDIAKQWMFYRIMAVVVGTVLLVLTAIPLAYHHHYRVLVALIAARQD